MIPLKIKIITGFRETQSQTIDGEEAHKAYYLFLHPEERAIFNNGVALIGKNIQGIEPDYNATMHWNADHELDGDDWNEIRKEGVDIGLRKLLGQAKQVALMANENGFLLNKKLSEIETPQEQIGERSEGMKSIGEMSASYPINQ